MERVYSTRYEPKNIPCFGFRPSSLTDICISYCDQVSEALSVGLPVVMSNETAEGFGLPFANEDISCIGYNTESFKNCIIIVHSNELIWNKLRDTAVNFIRKTHNRDEVMYQWSKIIQNGLNPTSLARKKKHCISKLNLEYPSGPCLEGEKLYKALYKDMSEHIHHFQSMFEHWAKFGRSEGRKYICET